MNECIRQRVVNRQLIVLLKAGKMYVVVQSKIRNQTSEIRFKRTIAQNHQVPQRAPLVGGGGDPGFLRPVSILRVGSDQHRQIFLLNEPRRSKEVILRQTILLSDL